MRYLVPLSFVAMIPMLNVLFGQTPKVEQQPVYQGINSLKSYVTDSMNYKVSQAVEQDPLQALILSIGLILVLFFLKTYLIISPFSLSPFYATEYCGI